MSDSQRQADSATKEHGVRVSAEQEMLSDTDQADLDTALYSMDIPIEDEDDEDDEEV
ncbi:MAG TPA: hypothetical protein V6D29_11480 [Leptolyngbyaceae cyanobacterium]